MAEVLSIEELRNRIDVIDEQLVRLLNVRVACAVEVGRLKHEAALPIYQPEREAEVLNKVRRSATELAGPLTAEAVVRPAPRGSTSQFSGYMPLVLVQPQTRATRRRRQTCQRHIA